MLLEEKNAGDQQEIKDNENEGQALPRAEEPEGDHRLDDMHAGQSGEIVRPENVWALAGHVAL